MIPIAGVLPKLLSEHLRYIYGNYILVVHEKAKERSIVYSNRPSLVIHLSANGESFLDTNICIDVLGNPPPSKVAYTLLPYLNEDFYGILLKGYESDFGTGRRKSFLAPALRVVIGIPGGSTPVDMRSIRDSASHAGAHDVEMIYEPMASALGIGLDVTAPNGNMIVDIGGGTTEIAVISLGGIVESASIHIAGNEITTDIIDYMAQQHNIHVGRTTADNSLS